MNERRQLPDRRPHVTQKVRLADRRTVYLATHADASPGELFVRVKGKDCTTEIIGLYDALARLASLALQYGAPLEKVGEMLLGVRFEPAGPVTGHPAIRFCSSLPDLIGRHLFIECCGRGDLAHPSPEGAPQ